MIATRDLLPFMEHLFLMGFQLFTCEKGERIRHSPMDLRVRGRIPLWIVAIAMSLALTPSAIAAPKTSTKAAGRSTTTVVNTILSGAGIPTKTIGIDGDFYIDTKNLNLYGPKTKGVWKITTSLKQVETKSVATVI